MQHAVCFHVHVFCCLVFGHTVWCASRGVALCMTVWLCECDGMCGNDDCTCVCAFVHLGQMSCP